MRSTWEEAVVPKPSTMLGRRRWTLPTKPGVYAVYVKDALVYIGSSHNIKARLQSHFTHRHWNAADVKLKFCVTESNWAARERRLVERLMPPDNRQWAWKGAEGHRQGVW